MSLNKSKLVYDATDGGDVVGAVLKASGGHLTSTTIGADEALDVNVVGQAGFYNEDDPYVNGGAGSAILMKREDTLAVDTSADGDWQFFKSTNKGELYVHDSDSLVKLTSMESFINQLTFSDGNLNVEADIDIHSDVADDAVDSENPIKMGSRSVFGLLGAISATGDKANLISDKYRRIYVNDSYNIGLKNSAATITTTAAQIAASPLAGRREIEIYNNSNKPMYVGFDNTVTTSTGFPIHVGSSYCVEAGEDLAVWLIGEVASQNARIIEIG
jgi:hypothetical protein